MPVRSLESFLFENKLVNTSSIEILKDATIGIDVEHYLSRIYTFKKEQFLFGIGGVPTSLNNYIQSDLKVFKEFNIRPVFVLPGLPIQSHRPHLNPNELSEQEEHLDTTWNRLNSKPSINGGNTFGYLGESFRLNTEPLPASPMSNDLVKLFIMNGLDYVISPYDSSFQLSYLYRRKVIDCIYGSTDVLLTQVDKFILGMEFQSKDFRFVDKQKILTELGLSERVFQDLSIMVGCSVQPETFSIFPKIPKPSPHSPYHSLNFFRIALDMFYQSCAFNNGISRDMFGYISGLNDPLLLNLYCRGHAAIRFMPVINTEGYVVPYSETIRQAEVTENTSTTAIDSRKPDGNESAKAKFGVPSELHSVISQRLPPEIYLYQSVGLLPLKLLDAITLGTYHIRPPAEIGAAESYKKLVTSKTYQNTLDSQFNLITQILARYYQVKKVDVAYWFLDVPVQLNQRRNPPVATKLRKIWYNVEMDNNFSMSSFWSNALECLSSAKASQAEIISDNISSIVSTAMMRALYLAEAVKEDGQPTLLIKTISTFASLHPEVSGDVLLNLFLLLLLVDRAGFSILHYDKLSSSVPGSMKDGGSIGKLTSNEICDIGLLSKVFSVSPLNIHPINYQGPISRSLLGFRSHLKIMQESVQSCLQACLVDMLARDTTMKLRFQTRNEYSNLIYQLPLYRDLNNTLMGVMCEIYLTYCMSMSKLDFSDEDCKRRAEEHLLDTILQVGKSSYNINLNSVNSVTPDQFRVDFKVAIEFWGYFKDLLEIAHDIDDSLISLDELNEIRKADRALRKFTS